MARAMVTEWGMSDKLGPLRYVDNQEEIFLGHSVARSQTVSPETAKLIDEEIRRIIEEAETKAREVLTEHMEDLHKVAKGLLEYETLSGPRSRRSCAARHHRSLRSRPARPGTAAAAPRCRPAVRPAAKAPGKDSPGGLEPEPQPEG